MASAAQARRGDGFYADAADVFLPGVTGASRRGTCSSLPVLYVAVGRRLGYPLKLVTTKGHLFVRWEDSRERFNFEAAGNGANRFSDAYYRHWPAEVSDAEIQAEGHLKSLSPSEELAVFLSIRGMCEAEHGRYEAAACSFGHAARFAPNVESYRVVAAQMRR
jgi:regulator of sirC expression with transglutaminase-like and TPR domain